MADREFQRRLTAVLAADVAGYTRLMEEDTDGTVAAWQDAREDVIKPCVADHSGKMVKLTGDGFLVEFSTVQDAVNCAIAMQQSLASSTLDFRMGINLGDIVDDGEDIHGEGVNVAARLEGLAEPGSIVISGSVHEQVKNRIKATYKDMGLQEVKNVSDPVQAFALHIETTADVGGGVATATDKPSIAVLPFDNLSGDPEQEYFSDGITEDIITAISRIRQFFVIARNTPFTYKGQAVDIQMIAGDLGVRYVLEGSVRKSGNRVRITAQLIDGSNGKHIWAERYDRELKDIFDVQDEITQTVVGTIGPHLDRAEQERALKKTPENLDAWDFVQRGWWYLDKWEAQAGEEAIRNFNNAVNIDRNNARAHTAIAYAHCQNRFTLSYAESLRELEIARESAEAALAIDDQDALTHAVLGLTYLWMHKHALATEKLQRALSLNPNFATAQHWLGISYVFDGQPEKGFAQQEIAARLSPNDPLTWGFMNVRAIAKFNLKEYGEAADWATRATLQPNCANIVRVILIACLSQLERWDECEESVDFIRERLPEFSVEQFTKLYPFKNNEAAQPWLNSLLRAGLPAT